MKVLYFILGQVKINACVAILKKGVEMAVLGLVILVAAVVSLIALALLKHLRLRRHFACVPGPRSYPIIGNAAQLKMNPEGIYSLSFSVLKYQRGIFFYLFAFSDVQS